MKISCARQDPNARNCHGYRKFVKRSVLENPQNGFMANDTIVIRYTIELVVSSGGALSGHKTTGSLAKLSVIQVISAPSASSSWSGSGLHNTLTANFMSGNGLGLVCLFTGLALFICRKLLGVVKGPVHCQQQQGQHLCARFCIYRPCWPPYTWWPASR